VSIFVYVCVLVCLNIYICIKVYTYVCVCVVCVYLYILIIFIFVIIFEDAELLSDALHVVDHLLLFNHEKKVFSITKLLQSSHD
jgi:hypothetical protein